MKKTKALSVFLVLLSISIATAIVSESDANPSFEPGAGGFALGFDWFGSTDRLERLEILKQVLGHIQENYVEPERVKPQEMFKRALDEAAQTVPEVRVLYPEPNRAVLLVDQKRTEFDTRLKNLYALHGAISDALKFIRDNRRSDISEKDLEISAVNGILATLDPHSNFLTSDMYNETKVGTTGKFGGLGIVIGLRKSKLTVIAPLDATPAFRAGLKAGDTITKIGDEPTINMSLTDAVNKMRGPKGTPVTIAVLRDGWTTEKSFTIVRDIINVVSVDSQLLPQKIGYVRIKNFQGNTVRDLSRHLAALAKRAGGSLAGLVLDLRNDPGGLLDQAIGVADKFLSNGPIVSTVGSGNKLREVQNATGAGTEPDYPMAVLIDQGSASASEIVAGALKRRDRAIVIGQRSFGKGSVQSLYDLPEDSALKLTIAQYLTPGDYSIQSVGIEPDLKLVPAIVSKEYIDLFRKKYFEGEAGLEHHLLNPNASKKGEAVAEIRYLEKLDDSEDAQMARAAGNPPAEELLKDFYVTVAHDLLIGRPQARTPDLIDAARGYAPGAQKNENQKIIAALKEKGVDWSPAPAKPESGCGIPESSWKLVPSKDRELSAGDKAQLVVSLKNPGPCTLYQARAATDSKNFLLNNREFLFGRVPPGAEISREEKVEIPKSMPTSLAVFQISFFEARDRAPQARQAQISIRSVPKPRFGFFAELKDSGGAYAKGNGDGLVQRGENVELKVHVKNLGTAPTDQATASLRALDGRDIEVKFGRIPFQLKPGEEKTLSFEIDVPARYMEKRFRLELSLVDSTYRASLGKKLEIPVYLPEAVKPASDAAWSKADGAVVHFMPDAKAPPTAYLVRTERIDTLGETDGFVRVELRGRISGWVAATDLTPSAPAKLSSGVPNPAVDLAWNHPPDIRMDEEKWAFTPATGQFLRIGGDVTDEREPKDLFVTVNGKKVFYVAFASMRPDETKFDTTIPLEVGLNRISVVARDRDDLFDQETFVVQRLSENGASKGSLAKAADTTFIESDFLLDPMNP